MLFLVSSVSVDSFNFISANMHFVHFVQRDICVLTEPTRLPGFHTCVGMGMERQDAAFYEANGMLRLS